MALQVSTEQCIFLTFEYTKKKGARELKKIFHKIQTRTENCEFSLSFDLYKTFAFNKNNLFTYFCFSKLLILRDKRFFGFFVGHKVKSFQKILKKTPYRRVAQKGYNFAPGAANHIFFDSPCMYKGQGVYSPFSYEVCIVYYFIQGRIFCTSLHDESQVSMGVYCVTLKMVFGSKV